MSDPKDRELATNLQQTCNHVATDSISRFAAIECLNGEMKLSDFENAKIVQDYLVRAVEKLYDLPSAQGYADTAYIERLSDLAFDSGFALGKASAQRWIPVTEGLPKEDGQYLTTNGQRWYEVASYAHRYSDIDAMYELPQDGGGWYIYDSEWGYCVYSSVVAWMPIEPWEGKEDEIN